MFNRPPILIDILHVCEFIAMIVAISNYMNVKKTHWKWLVFYLIYIFIYEITSYFVKYDIKIDIAYYLSFIQIPLEFIFFFWLFAYKSLQRKDIFWLSVVLFLISFFLENYFIKFNFIIKSLNYIVGTLVLFIMVVLEFKRQIKSESILNFKKDKMFYITIGVILFYIGNLPFFGLYFPILKEPQIWNYYYYYFIISNCIMYLLFAASFIWGKHKL